MSVFMIVYSCLGVSVLFMGVFNRCEREVILVCLVCCVCANVCAIVSLSVSEWLRISNW